MTKTTHIELRPPGVAARPRSLRAGALWAFWGNVGSAACQWSILSLMTKLTEPAQVGHFALALALVTPVVMLLGLQLRSLQATDVVADFGLEDYLGLRLLTAALGLLGVLAISLALGHRGQLLGIVAFVALAKTFDSVSNVFYGALHQRERLDLISVSQLLRGPLSLALVALLLQAGRGVLGAVVGMACTAALVLALYDIPVTRRLLGQERAARALRPAGPRPAPPPLLRPRFRLPVLRKLVVLALPLGVVMLLLSLIGNLPRYFVERSHGAAELGIYSALAYLLAAGMTVVVAVGEAATPRLARAYAQRQRAAYAQLTQRLLLLALGLGGAGLLVALLGGRTLLTLLYTPAYAERQGTFLLVMAAAAVSYVASLLGYAVTAARVLRAQTPMCAGVLAVTFAGCALWVPRYGIAGAALATLLGAGAQLAAYGLLYLRALHALGRGPAQGAP